MDLSRYRGIIFDLDGTLVDTMPLHVDAWRKTAKQFGFAFDAQWIYNLGGVPSRKIALMINEIQGLDLDTQELARIKTDHYVSTMHQADPIPVTTALLRRYAGVLPMAVGTGSPRANAEAVIANAGLQEYFQAVVTADDVEDHKPSPDTFLLAAERLGVAPQHCVVFEDTPIGVQAARAAGMDCILVKDGELIAQCD